VDVHIVLDGRPPHALEEEFVVGTLVKDSVAIVATLEHVKAEARLKGTTRSRHADTTSKLRAGPNCR
jgi:hypothetical protein